MNTVNNFVSYFNPFSDGFSSAVDGFRHDLSTTQRVATIAAAVIAGIFGLVISGFAVFRFTAEKWIKGKNETADDVSSAASNVFGDQAASSSNSENDDSRASSSTETLNPDTNSDVASTSTDKTVTSKEKRSDDPLKSSLNQRLNEIVSAKVEENRLDKVASFIQFLSADGQNFEKGQEFLKMLAEVLSDFSYDDQLSLFGVFGKFDSKKTDSDENGWNEFITYSLQLVFIKSKSEGTNTRSDEMYELLEELAYENADKKVLTLALKSMADEVRSMVTEALNGLDPKELDSDQEEWLHFMVGELFVDTMPVGLKLNKIKDEINQEQPGLFNHKGETSDHRRMKEYKEGYVKVMLSHMVDIVKEDPAISGEKAQTHMKLFITVLFPFYLNRGTEGLRSVVKELVRVKKPEELELLIKGFENSAFPLEALIAQDMNDRTIRPNQHIFMKAMLYVLFDEVNDALIANTAA